MCQIIKLVFETINAKNFKPINGNAIMLGNFQLGVCMDRVRSGWRDFLTQPAMMGQKKFNPTQPIM